MSKQSGFCGGHASWNGGATTSSTVWGCAEQCGACWACVIHDCLRDEMPPHSGHHCVQVRLVPSRRLRRFVGEHREE